MKQFILPLVALLGMSVPSVAHADTLSLGYVNENEQLGGNNGTQTGNVWNSAAIHIPAATVNTLVGKKITHINPGIQSTLKMEKLKIWVRSSLDGENLVEKEFYKSQEPKFKKGWNDLELDEAFEIPAGLEDGLYIGFSAYHTGVGYAFASSSLPAEGGFFTDFDGNGWKDNSEEGSLCLRATVEGEDLPVTNLSIVGFQAPEVLIKDRRQVKGKATVKNNGTADVSKFNVSVLVDGNKSGITERTVNIPSGGIVEFEFVIEPDITDEGDYQVEYLIDNINTGTDVDMTDNSRQALLPVIDEGVTRVVLIEEFTTEKCVNCPSAAYRLQALTAKEQYKDKIAVVCHHAGYYTDWLTTDFDEALTWFYAGDGTYAPAMMIDRATQTNTPVSNVIDAVLDRDIPNRFNKEPQVAIKMEAYYDENNDNLLHVDVNATKYTDVLCNNPAITLYLIEDNVKAIAQSGGGTNFVHQHVGRDTNETWGAPFEFDGNDFTYHYTFNVKSSYKKENLGVVAAIHNLNPSVQADWEVQNAAMLHAKDFKSTGVYSIADIEEEANAEYFTLSGVHVDSENLAPGIYIRKAGEKATKVVVK